MELDKTVWFKDFQYPKEYLKLLKLGLKDFEYWYFFEEKAFISRLNGLSKRYPNRQLVPFARIDDCDNIACFENGKGNSVQIIHDFATSGYEQVKEYSNFWAWFRDVIEELISSDEFC